MKLRICASVVALALAASGSNALADTVLIANNNYSSSSNNLGTFTGSVSYNSATSKVTFSLTNTSVLSPDFKIVAFVFNIPNSIIDHLTISSVPAGWQLDPTVIPAPSDTIAASPLGDWDEMFSIDGAFNGGGNNTNGIVPGSTGTWVANVFFKAGFNSSSINASSFLTETDGGQIMALRFQGAGKSDKIGTLITGNVGDTPSTPLPAAAWGGMALMGGLGLISKLRKRRTV